MKLHATLTLMTVIIVIGCGGEQNKSELSLPHNANSTSPTVKEREESPAEVSDRLIPPLSEEPPVLVPIGLPELQPAYAAFSHGGGSGHRCCSKSCTLGTAGHTDPTNTWYVVNTEAYPVVKPLSLDQNLGFTKGSIELTETGLKVTQAGSYWVSFSATMAYFSENENYTPLIPIFLIKNGVFEPGSTTLLGFTQSMPRNLIFTFANNGIMADLLPGDTLSLVITNGGSPQPEPITILAWGISAHKICD